MESFRLKKHDMELGCFVDEDGVIQVHMAGNLSGDYKNELHQWADAVREAMRQAKARNPEQVYCIVDLTGGVEADQESLKGLIDLVRHNQDYVTRTGVFGANPIMGSIVDIALKATGRKNMKIFKTREHAERWVLHGLGEEALEST